LQLFSVDGWPLNNQIGLSCCRKFFRNTDVWEMVLIAHIKTFPQFYSGGLQFLGTGSSKARLDSISTINIEPKTLEYF